MRKVVPCGGRADGRFSEALPGSSYTAVIPADLSSSSVSAEQQAETERGRKRQMEGGEGERGREREGERECPNCKLLGVPHLSASIC